MHTLFQLIESYNFKAPIDANGVFTIKNEQTNTNQTVYVVYTGSENIERGMQKIASRVT